MTRTHNPDDICAMCDEYSVKQAAPEYAALGMGLCQVAETGKERVHVEWNCKTCVSFRLDWEYIVKRRQYVQVQRLNAVAETK